LASADADIRSSVQPDFAIPTATTPYKLLRLATRFRVSARIVVGHYGYATDRWYVRGSLRGIITDDDIRELERISSTGQAASDETPGGSQNNEEGPSRSGRGL
jgi:hypothetical protein